MSDESQEGAFSPLRWRCTWKSYIRGSPACFSFLIWDELRREGTWQFIGVRGKSKPRGELKGSSRHTDPRGGLTWPTVKEGPLSWTWQAGGEGGAPNGPPKEKPSTLASF